MDHLNPMFISAGDAVSHFGVSQYALQFRTDLLKAMATRNVSVLTTAPFGWLFLQHHPEAEEQVILAPQVAHATPTLNLVQRFELPTLDSTLNIHMLPLAATLSNDVFVVGCDGHDPDPNRNEDFWGHSASAQYHGLVDTGHSCHPCFAPERARSTAQRFQESLRTSITLAEKNGRSITSLTPSFHKALDNRLYVPSPHTTNGVLRWISPSDFSGKRLTDPWLRRGARLSLTPESQTTVTIGGLPPEPTILMFDLECSEPGTLEFRFSDSNHIASVERVTVGQERAVVRIPIPVTPQGTTLVSINTSSPTELRIYQAAVLVGAQARNGLAIPLPSPSCKLPLHVDWANQDNARATHLSAVRGWDLDLDANATLIGKIHRPIQVGDRWEVQLTAQSNNDGFVTLTLQGLDGDYLEECSIEARIGHSPSVLRMSISFAQHHPAAALKLSNTAMESANIRILRAYLGFWRSG